MAWQSPTDMCELNCHRKGTETCIRHLLSHESLAGNRLSLGLFYGLRQVYFPNELPPCVHDNGEINWHLEAKATEETQVTLT